MEPASLAVNGIDPDHPLRPAIDERDALQRVFREVRRAIREASCTRAILVGHNSAFDLGFINEAIDRSAIKRNPFHPFSSFDTATLCGVAFGQTVLARAVEAAGLELRRGIGALGGLRRRDHGRRILRNRQPFPAGIRSQPGLVAVVEAR